MSVIGVYGFLTLTPIACDRLLLSANPENIDIAPEEHKQGQIRVERGEKLVFLEKFEEVVGLSAKKSTAVEVDDETAVPGCMMRVRPWVSPAALPVLVYCGASTPPPALLREGVLSTGVDLQRSSLPWSGRCVPSTLTRTEHPTAVRDVVK